MNRHAVTKGSYSQRGVTLVELMVSIAVGLILVTGLAFYFAGQKKTYSYQDALVGLQDSARTAFIIMSRDLRLAGYYGCVPQGGQSTAVANPNQNVAPPAGTFSQNVLDLIAEQRNTPTLSEGFELAVLGQNAADADGLGGVSDRLAINIAVPLGLEVEQMANATSDIVVKDPAGTAAAELQAAEIQQNAVVAVADCERATVFQVSNNVTADGGLTLSRGLLGTPSDNFSAQHIYGSDKAGPAELLALRRVRYYVRDTGTDRGFSLYRCTGYRMTGDGASNYCAGLAPQPEELISNVEAMQVQFGTATRCDGGVASYQYVDALATDPERAGDAVQRAAALNQTARATAVKITLTLSAPGIRQDSFATEAADRNAEYRQDYSTVIELRNGCQ